MRRLAFALCTVLVPSQAVAGLAEQCIRVQNDDTVHGYDQSVRAGLLKAYAQLFPQARIPSDEHAFQDGTHIRCMDGRLLACVTGANLPCSKMNVTRDNTGADAFCRASPDAPVVPAFATGHDAAYLYRCSAGRAEITGGKFLLDARGFAASLWAPAD